MKSKLLTLLLSVTLAFSAFVPMAGNLYGAKADVLDQADEYFVEFLLSDTSYDGEIDFEHSVLYDEQLNQWGREYTFTVGETAGFALMIEFNGNGQVFYEIEELYYDTVSPFADCLGLPVYIAHTTYLDYYNGEFYDLTTDEIVSADIVQDMAQNGFKYLVGSDGLFDFYEENITYSSKAITGNYSIQYDLPYYEGAVGTSCANTAGAVVIGYYDRFYENLLPDFQVYVTLGPALIYKSSGQEILELTTLFSQLMLIGEPHEGTTFSEFQLGMETYVEGQGYNYSTTNCFTNGSFDLNKYKTSVHNNKPVALFMLTFSMLNGVIEESGYDTVSTGYCDVGHVVVGCGYKTYTYYNANGSVKTTRNFLKVASGILNYRIGYLNINYQTDIRNAISIQIS